jgi:hypothetical protein
MTAKTAPAQPLIWALHDGKIGMANQALGLTEAVGFPYVEKVIRPRGIWRYISAQFWPRPLEALSPDGDRLDPPWPDLIVACGNTSVAPALAAKRASGNKIFWVQVQDPRYGRREADLVVAPSHDPIVGDNVFRTLGAVHRVTPERLAEGARRFGPAFAGLPRPLVAVLIGGDNRVYRLSPARLGELAEQLASLRRQGCGLAITLSRRSAAGIAATLRARLGGNGVYLWDGSGDNPYFGLLALADAVVVTADSVSMVSEAASTGKPVLVASLDGGSDKFTRFHRAMREAGATRVFAGDLARWSYPALDDTACAAAEIRRRFAARSAP